MDENTVKLSSPKRISRFLRLRVLGVDDSPQRIALGIALGLFVAWTPLYGLHTIMVLILACLLRANKLTALSAMLVVNPLTAAPAYYASYLLGCKVLSLFSSNPILPTVPAQELGRFASVSEIIRGLACSEFWRYLGRNLLQIGMELWLGCLIIGSVLAIAGYLATLQLIKRSRRKQHPL